MTILYSARAARYDLLSTIGRLAKQVTCWDLDCDQRLHHLMCYIHTTVDYKQVAWIGDDPADLTVHLYADADFAGCPYTLRSTSGEHHSIQGPNSRFPWAASSSGQTATAQSTPEAELASLNGAMKGRGESAIDIWQVILEPYHRQPVTMTDKTIGTKTEQKLAQ